MSLFSTSPHLKLIPTLHYFSPSSSFTTTYYPLHLPSLHFTISNHFTILSPIIIITTITTTTTFSVITHFPPPSPPHHHYLLSSRLLLPLLLLTTTTTTFSCHHAFSSLSSSPPPPTSLLHLIQSNLRPSHLTRAHFFPPSPST
ncbi:hypothetical protein Pmani_036605 [Petrolisthes manimaculis]|uniref:Uncharacterized protein n=1 Tax=Petrolisthes manimaculis TaxID=1843537 RepID=A0AAE1NJT3_9EUCA|nr:hypothetical protein Pmani_036605 [Petrolisthes manimaculis]